MRHLTKQVVQPSADGLQKQIDKLEVQRNSALVFPLQRAAQASQITVYLGTLAQVRNWIKRFEGRRENPDKIHVTADVIFVDSDGEGSLQLDVWSSTIDVPKKKKQRASKTKPA